MPDVRSVTILGGGISGLSVAHALLRPAGSFDVTLIEREARLGGNIRTVKRDGFVLDGGPDSWVASKPQATALARLLGLESRLIPTNPASRRVYIAWNQALHPLPEGMVLGIPTEILPIVKTPLFSWDAKLRMALEPLIPPRAWARDEDESIGDFVARRLGDEVAERLAGPLLGGIFAGDASELSVAAAFPQFVEAEKKYGSLVQAMRALRAARRGAASGGEGSAFLSLQGGLGELIDALAAKVGAGVEVRTGAAATRVEARRGGGFRVTFGGGETRDAGHLVLALPLPASAEIARTFDPELADLLDTFTVASTATVFLAYRLVSIPRDLDATGFLVPRAMRRSILASTWVSSKWDHRAPEGYALLRAFFGGARNEGILERDDGELVELARGDLEALMGIQAAPVFTEVFRFAGGSPQPRVGHLARVRAVKERLARWPGLHVTAGGFEGSGIPDCIRFGEATGGAISSSRVG